MDKKLVMIILIGLAMVFAVSAADENKGAEKITINGGNFGDINFPHQEHQKALGDCSKCHKLFPKKAGVIVEMKTAGTLKKKQVMDECRGCHKTMAQAGQKTGPLSCKLCHQKK